MYKRQPLKRSKIGLTHYHNFYDSLISSNRSDIIEMDYHFNTSFINKNLGIAGKLSLLYLSGNDADYYFDYFRNMPVFENEHFKGIVQALEIAEGKMVEVLEENRKLKELIVKHLPKKFYFQSTDDVNEVHDSMVENNMSCALIQNTDRPADIIDLSDFLHLMGQNKSLKGPSN